MDDEEDESFKPKIYPCPDCEFCKKPKTWEQTKYIKGATFMNKDACLECYKADEAKKEAEEAKKAEEARAIELLISKGMMIKNAQGEYEFKNFDYKPTRIGVITADS
jgi:hypothetical protein